MILGLFWVFATVSIWLPIRIVVYGLFVSISFGTLAVVPLEFSGGVTFVPATILSAIVIVRLVLTARSVSAVVDAMLNWRHLGLLIAFLGYSLLLTTAAPRLFAGVPTMGLNVQQLTPLAPSVGNITQSLYLTNSCLMTLAIFLLVSDEKGQHLFRKALIIGGTAAVLSGVADMATHGSTLLDPLRTATYALLTNADMAGARRVVGLQPEASAFGYATLAFGTMIVLMRPAETLGRGWRWLAVMAGWSCLAMAALSTSSGAIIGLVFFLLVLSFDTAVVVVRGKGGADDGRRRGNLTALIALTLGAGLAMTVLPSVGTHIAGIFDSAVLRKSSTESFEERLYWNTVSLQGLAATGGFGLGVGSTRASSWFVALASGTGVIGSVLLAVFVLNALLQPIRNAGSADRLLVGGAKRALLVIMLPFAGSATSVDFGLLLAFVFAVLTGIPAASAQIPQTSAKPPVSMRRRLAFTPARRHAHRPSDG